MKIFQFIIDNTLLIDKTNKLYYKLSNNAYIKNSAIMLEKNASVSLDTYYNIISSKYFFYANIDKPTIDIVFVGDITVELHLRTMLDDKIIEKVNFTSTKKATKSIAINKTIIEKNSFLFIKITSNKNDSAFFGGSFSCSTKPKNINLGVVICTYHREEFVKNNLNAIENYFKQNLNLQDNLDIFVVDNGKTLSKNDLPNYINLIPNENSGGAGGFTRGLREIINKGNFTHFLFMDDDISFEPSVLDRTVNLLSILKEEYKNASIGGTMLIKDNPTIQHEFGADWNGSKFRPIANNIDLSCQYGLLVDEQYFNPKYNAWWYNCMPTSVVKNGYPLEMLFVQYDDVEYGLRNNFNPIININGIAVWHENFSNKYNPSYEYFIKRNIMIVMSRFSKKGFFRCWIKYIIAVSKALIQQRYFMLDIVEKAYNDFLKGASYVASLNGPDILKELKPYCPVQLDKKEVEEKYNINLDEELQKSDDLIEHRFIEAITLNSYLLPKFTYKNIAVADMVNAKFIAYFKAKQVVHYNNYTNKAFVTTIDKKMLFKGLHQINKMFFKLLCKFNKAKKTYQNFDCK